MSAEPLTREERADRIAIHDHRDAICAGRWSRPAWERRWNATVQAEEAGRKAAEDRYRSAELSVVACKQRREEAEERKRAAEERAERLVRELRKALAMLNDSQHERDETVAWHKRINAARILHDALAADDAARGDK